MTRRQEALIYRDRQGREPEGIARLLRRKATATNGQELWSVRFIHPRATTPCDRWVTMGDVIVRSTPDQRRNSLRKP